MDDGVRDRLLRAWRGEIEAGAFYELIAQREQDPKRAEILRKMAAAESGHRTRLEARMAELGIPVPDPAGVRLTRWQRLQARVAPLDRLLAAREAAEEDEVSGLYLKPTGDRDTDRLLHEIRREERSHSWAVADLRGRGEPDQSVRPEQTRLDRILGREKWHRGNTGWLSDAIYGANDGLAAVFGIVAGVSGATGASHFVLTAGLAGAAASALSMASGAFLAARAETEVAEANLERERQEITDHPEEEREELSLFYQLKGMSEEDADALAAKLAEHPDAMLAVLATEEFGGSGGGGDPVQAAVAGGVSTAIGGILPVIPFFWLTGTLAIAVAASISLVAHFAVGAAKSLFTLRTAWASGLEMTAMGVIVGGGTYLFGLAFPGT